jgi:HlyD family secretion protein
VAQPADTSLPILLEFESPTAALVAQPVPRRSRYAVWVLASMFAVMLTLMSTVPIDRVVTGQGRVVATSANLVVQPLETSIVRSVEVKEGQLVRAGQVLARLDPTFAAADLGSLEVQRASLQAEVDRLQAEVDDRTYISDGTPPSQLQTLIYTQRRAERGFRLENYRQKIDGAQLKVMQAQADVAAYSERLGLARTVEGKRRELERLQVGSQLNTLQAIDTRLEVSRSLATAQSAAATSQRELDALIAERDSYTQQARNESSQQLTEQGRKLSDVKENLNKAALRRSLVELRADRDCIVLSVASVSVGSVMQSGDQFITLVPVDTPLEVETILDARDAGFVRVGDPVIIKFDTFPYSRHGWAEGLMRAVSPDSFRNPMEDRAKPQRPRNADDFGNLYYRTRVSLDTIKLHDLPEGFRMSPGMPVTADIKIGHRTVMEYFFSRVIPTATEGMREP